VCHDGKSCQQNPAPKIKTTTTTATTVPIKFLRQHSLDDKDKTYNVSIMRSTTDLPDEKQLLLNTIQKGAIDG
jgi:hypothetical protein